jgi:hypothetical protein
MVQGKRFDMAEEFAGLDFHSIRLESIHIPPNGNSYFFEFIIFVS